MRPVLLALAAAAALALPLRAAELRFFDDAALHAVQFVDKDEGWGVGDEGVVWHTIDGGKTWERQPTGVRASLRSVHFLNPYTGWIAGREELPHGGGSAGVLLFTQDGGLKWHRITLNTLPGLNKVRFLDGKVGYAVGDGADHAPSGVYQTTDAGQTWKPLPGPRCPSWLTADFVDANTGVLAGAWNRLASVRGGKVAPADVDTLGGRSLRGVQIVGKRGIAVGQGALVLLSDDVVAGQWAYADLQLPTEIRAAWDFHAVHCHGEDVWIAGRPGSVILHSGNRGRTWEVQSTGQNLPLNGLHFVDAKTGWAVGEYGVLLGTTDGGKTWNVQRRGGQQAAVLFVHARASTPPLETVARLGAEDGYLATALRVMAPDPGSQEPMRASDPMRLSAAMRLAGGAASETLWQFPLPQHLARAGRSDLIAALDNLHAGRGADEMLRQLVLALRIWRPTVVVTDHTETKTTGLAGDTLVAEAVQEAFRRAADPKAYPEHLDRLGLTPWKATKLYSCWHQIGDAQVTVEAADMTVRLEASPRDFAAVGAGLIQESPTALPASRHFRMLAATVDDAANHTRLFEGIVLAPGGPARRALEAVKEPDAEIVKAVRARRNLTALVEGEPGELTTPDRILGQLGPTLEALPYDHAAPAALTVASHYARIGQWAIAREAFLLMADRYPSHPLTAEAYRWLIRHGSSSEARRRHEMGQFLSVANTEFTASKLDQPKTMPKVKGAGEESEPRPSHEARLKHHGELTLLANREETRRWYQGCLEVEPRLAGFGPVFHAVPSVQFCLASARRALGEFDDARKLSMRYVQEAAEGPWKDAAAAELWLANRTGAPPKPVLACRGVEKAPFLDGKLNDECWQTIKPVVLRDAVGATAKDYATEVWVAYDTDHLYLAVRCTHPVGKRVPAVKVRPRDADVRPYDRVGLLLDLDRDYTTAFHLQIDQRGCVCDDCWGDVTWNPRWFVAVQSDETGWTAEAAVPLIELTGDRVTVGKAWAGNVVRVVPGKGVQAFSTPADVVPRPEGMGLLMFLQDPKTKEEPPTPTPAAMSKVP